MSVVQRLAAAIVFIVAIGSSFSLRAQETINYGSIAGRVVDQTGGVIPGAEVTALHVETHASTRVTTDAEGRFRLSHLRPGTYEIVAKIVGFRDAVRRLSVTAGSAFDLSLAVELSVSEQITISLPWEGMLETARTQVSSTITRTETNTVPLNGRQFLDLALLTPGVSPTNVGGGTQLFPETSAVPGVGISVSSQRNLSNNFMVDGLSANDDAAALGGLAFSVNAVEDFQVVSAGGQAELGRALGGHVNVTTRSGTNGLSLDADSFFRTDRLNAPNALTGAKLPMRQRQFSANAGGPIVANRTFFFVNTEVRRLDQSGVVTIGASDPSVVDRINTRLTATGYRGPLVTTGVYDNPLDTTFVLAKIDHAVRGTGRLTLRYSQYAAQSENARGAGGTSATSASAGIDSRDRALALSLVDTLGAGTLLEVRGQFAPSTLDAMPSDSFGPSVAIAGVATFGRLSSSPTGRDNSLSQVVANVTRLIGPHAFKAGVDYSHNDTTIRFPRASRGAYTFSSLANFLNGTYNASGFTQTFGATEVPQQNPNAGVYLQMEWRARDGLTLNAGLRYDLQWLETISTDRDNFSPRLGIAWSTNADIVIRANAGRFYDRLPLRAVANALLSAGNTTDLAGLRQTNISLSPGQAGAPMFPSTLDSAIPSTTLVNFTTMDRNIETAYSDKVGVELERTLGAYTSVAVGYDRLRGRKLVMQINQNVPACAASGTNNGCRPIAQFANNNQYRSAGSSDYDGLHVSFVERHPRWGMHRVSYTYSASMNNVGEAFFSGPIDPFDLSKDWARSDDDQRHRLVITGSVSTPTRAASWPARLGTGLQFSWMMQYYSALPFNITTGANTIQGTVARPVADGAFITRNAGVGDSFKTTSVRISRIFATGKKAKVEGLVEVFNLFNVRNDLNRVTVFGTGAYPSNPAANFGTVTVVGEPRSIQLGIRVRY